MTYRFTARAVAAEVDVDGEMQAGLAEYEDEDGTRKGFSCCSRAQWVSPPRRT
ncbi:MULTISPECIES: hypothetical protein [Streptomyces]|jgi:hypothetical protein|uniref:hypothetical protein n=1 Tax=Streptomyces TaxID=1883 RepID=UPI0026E05DE0|nr:MULTISPECIES: hypothetical protein [unclassified Streptomyces]MDF9872198.1 hypothetical protein [Streptomyces pratensis]MDX2621895.1 hypothetical protein [Streptomyces sp. WI03-5b]